MKIEHSPPGVGSGSNDEFVMMYFHLLLKKISKPKFKKVQFNLAKLKDPEAAEGFEAI